jgi:CubicO group peptidase (beta-lactamase class C family)
MATTEQSLPSRTKPVDGAKLKSSAAAGLKSQIDEVTKDPHGAPGIVFAAVNKAGDIMFEHASGKTGAGRSEDMTTDNVFWIASCTKMITGIACMQLVEQGKLKLDDVEGVEKLAPVSSPSCRSWSACRTQGVGAVKEPQFLNEVVLTNWKELKAVQVLENGKLVPKKRGITLRMLLSHTGRSLFLNPLSMLFSQPVQANTSLSRLRLRLF